MSKYVDKIQKSLNACSSGSDEYKYGSQGITLDITSRVSKVVGKNMHTYNDNPPHRINLITSSMLHSEILIKHYLIQMEPLIEKIHFSKAIFSSG